MELSTFHWHSLSIKNLPRASLTSVWIILTGGDYLTIYNRLGVGQEAILVNSFLPRDRFLPVEALFAKELPVPHAGLINGCHEISLTLGTLEAGRVKRTKTCRQLLRLEYFPLTTMAFVWSLLHYLLLALATWFGFEVLTFTDDRLGNIDWDCGWSAAALCLSLWSPD